MSNDSDRPTKRHLTPTSELFPRVHDDPKKQAAENFDVLSRHGRVITSHTNQLLDFRHRIGLLERADPVQTLNAIDARFTAKINQVEKEITSLLIDKVNQLDKDITRLRTAVYVAAVIIGGGFTGTIATNAVKKDMPPTVQIPPELLDALRKQ